MIANRQQCLEPDALNDLLSGRLPPDRFASALAHVDACDQCSQAVESANGSSGGMSYSWIARAVQDLPRGEQAGFDHEVECQAVVGNLILQPNLCGSEGVDGRLPAESLGPYRLLKWLGSGGMGSVYLAEHQRLKRLAAIKLLPREKLIQTGWLDRFNREMTSIAALEHPHVVRAIDAGDEGGWHYLVMEYLDGADLSKVSRRMGELPLRTVCELIRQAALGLGAIHSLGMTHRDVKPSNLFLTRAGTVKLLDLGLVLSGDSPLASDERLTTVGHLMGTVPYMAREQLNDASAVDWRADIYSLGATMFRLLTGRAPFGPATNLAQTIQAISTSPCPSLRSLKPDVPEEIAGLIDRMLSHDPARRPQSADEVAQSLASFSDSAAPPSLIRAALSAPDAQDEQLSSQMQPNAMLLAAESNAGSGRAKSRWPLWIAAAFAPLAFFAGILITVTTDKGTLVIESDEPGVTVNVTQGDKVIESLRVEQSAKSIRLQSGKYLVELIGVDSDGLEISDSQVLLTRGDKQIVKVQRRAASEQLTADTSTGSLYQGQTFAHWLTVLEREKDIAVMAHAMHAVQMLADTDDQKAAAARRCLLAARQLGGFTMSNRPAAGLGSNDPSGWFMTELTDSYTTYFPEPGFGAIIEELEQGNERSAQACVLLLALFQQGSQFSAANFSGSFDEHLETLMRTLEGRSKVLRLSDAIAKHVDKMSLQSQTYIHDTFVAFRIRVLDALGENLAEQPQVVAWAKRLAAAGDAVIENKESYAMMGGRGGMSGPDQRGVNLGRSPLGAWTAMMIGRTLESFPGKSVVVGLLEPSLDGKQLTHVKVTDTLARFARDYPQETASAILAHLERLEKPNSGWGGVLNRTVDDERSKIAKSALLATTEDSIEVVRSLARAIEIADPGCIFSKEDIEELLRQMAFRMTRESQDTADPKGEEKDQLALYIYANLGLPYVAIDGVPHYEQAACDLLVARRWKFFQRPDKGLPTWPSYLSEKNRNWDPSFTRTALHTLLVRYPEEMVSAYAASLDGTPFTASRTTIISPLISAMESLTPQDKQLGFRRGVLSDKATDAEALVKYLQSDRAAQTIEELGRVHQKALEKLRPQLAFQDLQSLLLSRLAIANYLGRDVTQEPAVLESLRTLVDVQQKRGEPSKLLSLELLFIVAEKFGFDAIPFQAFQAAGLDFAMSDKCDVIKKLVTGLHDSRPDEFCEFFTEDLERFAKYLDDAKSKGQTNVSVTAMHLYGGLSAECDVWYHELLERLLQNSKTKDRTVTALKQIITHLPTEDMHYLEDVLPKS